MHICIRVVINFFFYMSCSERFKEDYEKLEALLQTLPNKISHEVMVSLVVGGEEAFEYRSKVFNSLKPREQGSLVH